MPIAPAELFSRIGLAVRGSVGWGNVPDTDDPGIYAISLCRDPAVNDGLLASAPIDLALVDTWIKRVPTFCLCGTMSPSAVSVAQYLSSFWLDDESIVYIGKATCLRSRLTQFRGHRLGNRSPHAGGHWIKTLSNLSGLFIHYCTTASEPDAVRLEEAALRQFKSQVTSRHAARLRNPIPFANREHPQGNRKQTDLCGDVLR